MSKIIQKTNQQFEKIVWDPDSDISGKDINEIRQSKFLKKQKELRGRGFKL